MTALGLAEKHALQSPDRHVDPASQGSSVNIKQQVFIKLYKELFFCWGFEIGCLINFCNKFLFF